MPDGVRRKLDGSDEGGVPGGSGEDPGKDVGDVDGGGDEKNFFDAFVISLDDEQPDEDGADGHGQIFTDMKELHAAGDSGKLRNDVAEIDDDEKHHHQESDAEAELFTDEVAEALAGDDAHAGAHLLDDDEGEGDGDHHPQQLVAVLGAGLGVGEDAAGIVIDVGGDEAGTEHGEEEHDPDSPSLPHRF